MKIITTIVKWTLFFTLAFLNALVAFKYYEWFGPETGLTLPNLTYLNILAIMFIVNQVVSLRTIISSLISLYFSVLGITNTDEMSKLDERSDGLSITLSITYHIGALFSLGLGYLIYVIVY